jgi:anti-sigma B factor antagonist
MRGWCPGTRVSKRKACPCACTWEANREPGPDSRPAVSCDHAYPTCAAPKRWRSSECAAGDAEREPLAAVPALVGHVVDEMREDSNEPVVLRASAPDGPEGEPEAALVGIDLERDGLVVARIERAQDRQLEVVGALVREVQSASDPAEHERGDASEACLRRHREHDSVAHVDLDDVHPRRIDDHLHSSAVVTSRDFDVHSETMRSGAAVLHVSGELDLASAPRLAEALTELSADPVVVDLTECTFLDSAGMAVLVASARALSDSGRSLRVVAPDAGILRVLEITAVDTLIAIHPDVESAL